MEYENKYASKGVAGAGLGLGIAGTALGVMAGGLNGRVFWAAIAQVVPKTITLIAMKHSNPQE